jgi:hypothetical protein
MDPAEAAAAFAAATEAAFPSPAPAPAPSVPPATAPAADNTRARRRASTRIAPIAPATPTGAATLAADGNDDEFEVVGQSPNRVAPAPAPALAAAPARAPVRSAPAPASRKTQTCRKESKRDRGRPERRERSPRARRASGGSGHMAIRIGAPVVLLVSTIVYCAMVSDTRPLVDKLAPVPTAPNVAGLSGIERSRAEQRYSDQTYNLRAKRDAVQKQADAAVSEFNSQQIISSVIAAGLLGVFPRVVGLLLSLAWIGGFLLVGAMERAATTPFESAIVAHFFGSSMWVLLAIQLLAIVITTGIHFMAGSPREETPVGRRR